MLHTTDAQVTLLGFSRGAPPDNVGGLVPTCLGTTEGGRLGQRIAAVLRAAINSRSWRGILKDADVVIARQLEMLVLAARARDAVAPNARLVYECLDIHRLMVDAGVKGRMLRRLEGRLLGQCQALMVSSPAFIRAHFARRYRNLPSIELVENKVLAREIAAPDLMAETRNRARPNGPPWRIGWFGMIRCSRSLDLLAALAQHRPGLVEVVIRGRVARDAVPTFDEIVARTPHLTYLGPYDRQNDLAAIYGDVHFAWSVDYFEAGANSDWLLPNRIYEGGLFGAVPICRPECATASWLLQNRIGVILNDDKLTALQELFQTLTMADYDRLASAVRMLPAATFLYDEQDCATIMQTVLAPRGP